MVEKNKEVHQTVLRALRKSFSPNIIERTALSWEARFKVLDIRSLPEYESATEALKALQAAAEAHYESEYSKRKDDSPYKKTVRIDSPTVER